MPRAPLALLSLLLALPAAADTSVDGASEDGPDGRTGSLDALFDLKPGWEVYSTGEFSATGGARSDTVSAGVSRSLRGGGKASVGASRWEDSEARMSSLGPVLGLETPLGPFEASFDLEGAFYTTDVFQPERVIRRRRRTVIEPSVTERVRLSQWHPSVSLALPLFGGALKPAVYAGRTVYSRDPAEVIDKIGELEFARNGELVAEHIGGFQSHDAEASLEAALPGGMTAALGLGAERSAVDGAWTTTQSASLAYASEREVELTLEWSRSLSYGERADQWTVGAAWRFGAAADDEDDEGGDEES